MLHVNTLAAGVACAHSLHTIALSYILMSHHRNKKSLSFVNLFFFSSSAPCELTEWSVTDVIRFFFSMASKFGPLEEKQEPSHSRTLSDSQQEFICTLKCLSFISACLADKGPISPLASLFYSKRSSSCSCGPLRTAASDALIFRAAAGRQSLGLWLEVFGWLTNLCLSFLHFILSFQTFLSQHTFDDTFTRTVHVKFRLTTMFHASTSLTPSLHS